jgi:hypothetical protein
MHKNTKEKEIQTPLINDQRTTKVACSSPISAAFGTFARIAISTACLSTASCDPISNEVEIRLNPNPIMHYTVDVFVENPPGAFDSVDASVDYGVTDSSCVPEQPISGARLLPTKKVDLKLKKIGENSYETDMYVDLLHDENYYSMGVCHWSLAAITVTAKRRGMAFITPLSGRNFRSSGTEKRYFSFSSYLESAEPVRNMGNTNRDAYSDPSKTFSIKVVTRETRQ